jgi:hypothetical protein
MVFITSEIQEARIATIFSPIVAIAIVGIKKKITEVTRTTARFSQRLNWFAVWGKPFIMNPVRSLRKVCWPPCVMLIPKVGGASNFNWEMRSLFGGHYDRIYFFSICAIH